MNNNYQVPPFLQQIVVKRVRINTSCFIDLQVHRVVQLKYYVHVFRTWPCRRSEVQLSGQTAKIWASIPSRTVNDWQLNQTLGDCCLKKLWNSSTQSLKWSVWHWKIYSDCNVNGDNWQNIATLATIYIRQSSYKHKHTNCTHNRWWLLRGRTTTKENHPSAHDSSIHDEWHYIHQQLYTNKNNNNTNAISIHHLVKL